MSSQGAKKRRLASFRRKPESRKYRLFWTPASAGGTALMRFFDTVTRYGVKYF